MRGPKDNKIWLINAEPVTDTLRHVCMNREHESYVKQIANLIGVPYQTAYSQVSGATQKILLDTLRAAHFVTHAPELESFLLWPGRRSIPLPSELPPSEDYERECGDVTIAVGRLHDKVRIAVDDGYIDTQEEREIRKAAEQALAEIQDILSLMSLVRSRGGRVKP